VRWSGAARIARGVCCWAGAWRDRREFDPLEWSLESERRGVAHVVANRCWLLLHYVAFVGETLGVTNTLPRPIFGPSLQRTGGAHATRGVWRAALHAVP